MLQTMLGFITDDLEGEPLMEAKIQSLLALLARLSFHQAVVFCNSRPDAEYLAEQLVLPLLLLLPL